MERLGRNVPTLQTRPELPVYLELYLTAYMQLSTDRQIGMVVGSIPYGAILNWCYSMGMEDIDDIDDLATVVWKVDSMVQEHFKKQTKTPIGGQPKPALPVATGKIIGRG